MTKNGCFATTALYRMKRVSVSDRDVYPLFMIETTHNDTVTVIERELLRLQYEQLLRETYQKTSLPETHTTIQTLWTATRS